MTTAALALRYRNGTPQAFRHADGGFTALGNAFGSDDSSAVTGGGHGSRVIQIEGELFALTRSGFFKKKNPLADAGDWESLASWTAQTQAISSGIYLYEDAGVPTLIWVSSSTQNYIFLLYKMALTRPFTPTQVASVNLGTSGALSSGVGGALHLDGSVYMIGSQAGGTGGNCTAAKFDVLNGTGTHFNQTVGVNFYGLGGTYALVNGRVIYTVPTTTGIKVFEWPNTLRTTVGTTPGTPICRNLVFWPDSGDDFYVFAWQSNTNWKVYKMALDVWSATDITSTVLPGGVSSPGHGNGKVYVIGDRTTTPGTTQWVLAFGNGTAVGNSLSFYDWNGEALITAASNPTGGQVGDALAEEHHLAAGEYHYLPGELDVSLKSRAGTLGGTLLTFIGHGDPVIIPHGGTTSGGGVTDWVEGETITGATTGTTATLLRRDPNGDDSALHVGNVQGAGFNGSEVINGATGAATMNAAATGGAADKVFKIYTIDSSGNLIQGTLAGAATGGTATRVGNEVQNVIADGATEYTIRWDFIADGFAIGQRADIVPSMSV